jgi:hypothetical protein
MTTRLEFVGGPLDGQSIEMSEPHDFTAIHHVFEPADSFADDAMITGKYVARGGSLHWVPA